MGYCSLLPNYHIWRRRRLYIYTIEAQLFASRTFWPVTIALENLHQRKTNNMMRQRGAQLRDSQMYSPVTFSRDTRCRPRQCGASWSRDRRWRDQSDCPKTGAVAAPVGRHLGPWPLPTATLRYALVLVQLLAPVAAVAAAASWPVRSNREAGGDSSGEERSSRGGRCIQRMLPKVLQHAKYITEI